MFAMEDNKKLEKRQRIKELIRDLRNDPTSTSARDLDLKGISLAGEDLSGIDLCGADLSGTDLTGTNLSDSKLFRAKLNKALLLNANLQRAELTGADLTEADLEGINGTQVGMGMACLKGARLFRANMEGATLSKSNLNGTDLRCTCLRNARLREADMTGADLTSADLQAADLSLCNVSGATFTNADMRETRLRAIEGFRKATWIGVDIRDINFAGAYRMRRFIIDQNYLKEFRESSRLAGLVYYLWWITSDCGRSLTRWCAWILVQLSVFAGLYAFVGVDYGEYPTWLSSFYYSVVTMTTLGYGDVVPSSTTGQMIAIIEVITGYIMLGGLLSIFSVKMARRGD